MSRTLRYPPETPAFPIRRPWSSLEFLRSVGQADLATYRDQAELQELLKFDMNTEYDAVNLSDYVKGRYASGTSFSDDFWLFCDAWRADEWNHYLGYRKLYGLCTGRSAEDLHEEVRSRPVDFGPIASFLHDEFWICMVVAYDELFTVRSCQQDYDTFAQLGQPCLLDWIKLVARDEGYHYRNALEVIRRHHLGRIDEVPAVLEAIRSWDMEGHEYKATFVLDHEETRYDPEMLKIMADRIMVHLTKRADELQA